MPQNKRKKYVPKRIQPGGPYNTRAKAAAAVTKPSEEAKPSESSVHMSSDSNDDMSSPSPSPSASESESASECESIDDRLVTKRRRKAVDPSDINLRDYRSFLADIFPSSYMAQKVAETPSDIGLSAVRTREARSTSPSPPPLVHEPGQSTTLNLILHIADVAAELAADYDDEDDEDYVPESEAPSSTDVSGTSTPSLLDEKNPVRNVRDQDTRERLTSKYKTMISEKFSNNELEYFRDTLTVKEQKTVLKQLKEVYSLNLTTVPSRLSILRSDIPPRFKAIALRKVSTLNRMEPGAGEYFKLRNWVDGFRQIPFGIYSELPVTMADGLDKCHEFITNAKRTLDQAVYGLDDAKMQIMQMIGQWIVNPQAIGSAIAIKGPMGTGKTTLVKEGISKILNRPFAFIALGGATDSAFLEGHSYTYEGSKWGHIVDILMQCKSMNPVIYFDELDKISDTPKGEEITGILTHLTDTSQNMCFHDRYYADMEFDLSRCLFIFSYNDESKINPILRDRMYRIMTKGYEQPQKLTIARNYLLPKIQEQVKFTPTEVVLPDETINYIIRHYTDKEDGVRTLKRCLELIHTKLNLQRLMKPDAGLFEDITSVTFPVTVTNGLVDKLIHQEVDNGMWRNMYC